MSITPDRRGDWERGVDENLAMLNTAQRVGDKQLEDLELEVSGLDRIIRGDLEDGKIGMGAQVDALETLVNSLRAEFRALTVIVTGDHADGDGLEQRIVRMENRREDRNRNRDYFWHFVTATVSGTLVLAGLLVLNWERVEEFGRHVWEHWHPAPTIATVKPKHSKHKRKQKPIVVPVLDELSKPEDMPE